MITQAIPAYSTGPKAKPAKSPYHGHFLSMIGFDGMVTMHTVESILLAQGKLTPLWRGWKFHAGEGQIRSRNECVHQFLNTTDCRFHDWVDSDIRFQEPHIRALRRHPEADDSIICGAYPKKQTEKIDWCYNSLKDGNPEPNERGLMEIAKGGTGFMQVPRNVYERIMAKFPERLYDCDYDFNPDGSRAKKFSFFYQDVKVDEDSGLVRDLSEDWAFCYLARKAGVKIYLDVTTTHAPWIEHRGPIFYPPASLIKLYEREAQLEALKKEIADLKAGFAIPPAVAAAALAAIDTPAK